VSVVELILRQAKLPTNKKYEIANNKNRKLAIEIELTNVRQESSIKIE
jgi:hypothetical protein